MIAAFGLGLAVLAIPPPAAHREPGAAAAAGAGFALATLGGYLLSAWTGLFGFKEVRTGAGIAAGLVEVAAFACWPRSARARPANATAGRTAPARFPAQIPPAAARAAGTAAGGLTVAALVLFGLVVAGASAPPPAATGTGTGTGLKTTTIGGTTVLTNANGRTLYSSPPTPRPPPRATAAAPRTGPR